MAILEHPSSPPGVTVAGQTVAGAVLSDVANGVQRLTCSGALDDFFGQRLIVCARCWRVVDVASYVANGPSQCALIVAFLLTLRELHR